MAFFRPRERQIEFPVEQTHVKMFEWIVLLGSLVLTAVVIILVLTVDGPFIGPWG